MCISNPFSSPSTPSPPPIVAPIVAVPKLPPKRPRDANAAIRKVGDTQKNKARAFAARGGTLVTGVGGLTEPVSTRKKTLLGA